jgi:flagellar basal-body rod protein FlgF|tara:strand:- start:2649 stop:3389 length:741 start_codon:yes stop_codon:yes gene_type:complete
MDHFVYIAASGAQEMMLAQAANSHNLANAATPGFKADLVSAESRYLDGVGAASRVYTIEKRKGTDLAPGSLEQTGRDLDVALVGEGWIAVQAPDGTEALTRRGDLRVDEFGQLVNGGGQPVLGERGPIALPPFSSLTVGADGTVSIVPLGEQINAVAVLDRIKLVNPPADQIDKGPDGLLRAGDGLASAPAAEVRLASGMLESSNVNPVSAMVHMIELARQYEMHVRMMSTAQELDTASTQLMRLE